LPETQRREGPHLSLPSTFPTEAAASPPQWVARRSGVNTTSRGVTSSSVSVQVARGGRADPAELKKEERKTEEEIPREKKEELDRNTDRYTYRAERGE